MVVFDVPDREPLPWLDLGRGADESQEHYRYYTRSTHGLLSGAA